MYIHINKIYIYENIFIKKGGYSSIGRTIVCGTISFLFNSGYPPYVFPWYLLFKEDNIIYWYILVFLIFTRYLSSYLISIIRSLLETVLKIEYVYSFLDMIYKHKPFTYLEMSIHIGHAILCLL